MPQTRGTISVNFTYRGAARAPGQSLPRPSEVVQERVSQIPSSPKTVREHAQALSWPTERAQKPSTCWRVRKTQTSMGVCEQWSLQAQRANIVSEDLAWVDWQSCFYSWHRETWVVQHQNTSGVWSGWPQTRNWTQKYQNRIAWKHHLEAVDALIDVAWTAWVRHLKRHVIRLIFWNCKLEVSK